MKTIQPVSDTIEIKIVKSANRDEIFQLYLEGHWWKAEEYANVHIIDTVIKNSFCFVGAFAQGKLIGMGRAISDGISDAYIQDVIVTASYRQHKIGRMIVKKIVEHLKFSQISWIGLIAVPQHISFYQKLGFKAMDGHLPMLLSQSDSGDSSESVNEND